MAVATRKLRSPLKWHGGKSYLARRIVALFPPHRVYVEPFAGGLNVLLNKPPAEREVASDANADLMAFWWHLKNSTADLLEILRGIEYSRESWFEWGHEDSPHWGLSQQAEFLVRNRFSRGGLGKDFAWSDRLRGKHREGGAVPGDVNAWDTIRAELPAIAARIAGVELDNLDAVNVIQANDAPDALIYCDPPYLHSTRTHTKAYAHEMARDDHAGLLSCLKACAGRVFLSGYRSDLYDEALAGWTRHDFDMPNHSGQGKSKQRRIECVWTNA